MDRVFSRDRSAAYLVAVAAAFAALLLKLGIDQLDYQRLSPFRFFFLPVVVAAWYGGLRPGLVALFLGAFLTSVLYLRPTNSVWVTDWDEALQLVMFLLEGGLICVLAGKLHAQRELAFAHQKRAEAASRRIQAQTEELTRAENQIAIAMHTAQAGTRAKTDFLANISHELRTPMNAIIGMTELSLQEPDLPTAVRDNLQVAFRSATSLTQLVNDLLDFSRMEAQKFELAVQPFWLRDVVDDSVRALAVNAHECGLELVCQVAAGVPLALRGDALRLRQIINNLVGNAIKFTEEGEVFINVTVESQQDQHVVLRFCVADTGIGIAPGDMQKIFEPFTQVDASTTRRYHGSGLGLAITNQLVNAMRGRMWVESELGTGSKFYFNARFDVVDANEVSQPQQMVQLPDLAGMEVLVVDDNATNRQILFETLSGWGIKPVMAASGAEAIKLLSKKSFPLVVLDALMPEMDGFQVAEKIKEDPRLAKATILMLSSSDRQIIAHRSKDLDIAACLEKPVSQRDLARAIRRACLEGPGAMSELPAPVVPALAAQPLNILVSEDTPANQKVVARILERRGHQVTVANDGREAVDYARGECFDVILMDVQMPIMDGFQATAMIRAFPAMSNGQTSGKVPIVAMTAHAMRGDRERCLAAGMDEYISKPIDAGNLLQIIETLTEGGASAQGDVMPNDNEPAGAKDAAKSMGTSAASALDSDAVTEEQSSSPAGINLQAALVRLANDRTLLREMIDFFLEDAPVLLQQARDALHAGDMPALRRAAHSIKGLAANFEALGTVSAALKLEKAAEANQTDDVSALFSKLEDSVQDTVSSLRTSRERYSTDS